MKSKSSEKSAAMYQRCLLIGLIICLTQALWAKPLSPNQVKKIQGMFVTEQDLSTRTKLYVLLINDAVTYQTPQEELKYRGQLLNELNDKKELREQHYANLYQLGILNFKSGSLDKAFMQFEQLLKTLPLSKTKLRNLTLQHLSIIAAKMGRADLEEKYLSLYVISQGKVSDFYESTGGYEKLLQIATKTLSGKNHYYFQNWYNSALQNGDKSDRKKVLTQWVNFATQKKENFSDQPFEMLLEFLKTENQTEDLKELRLLYAQTTPDENKKLAIYEDIQQGNQALGTQTELGILTRLFKAYQTSGNAKKEQQILEILAERNDYDGRQDALKQLALVSLKNEDWMLSLKAHKKMQKLVPLDTSQEGVLILDNLISISQRLSKDDLTLQFLREKILNASPFVDDTAKYKAFTLALDLYKQNQEFDAAIELYGQMLKVSFQEKPFAKIYEIHFQGALAAEGKRDFEKAISFYQLSLDALLQNKSADLHPALKIAQKILFLTESYFPGEREINVLNQISAIHTRRGQVGDLAKTELIIAQKQEKSGNKKEALTFYNKALDDFRQINDNKMVSQLLTLLSNLEEGLSGAKLKRLQELEETQQKSGNQKDLIITRLEIGNYYKAQGDLENAIKYYLKASETLGTAQNGQKIQAAYYGGLLLSQTGDIQRANQIYQKALDNIDLIGEHQELFVQIHQAYAKNLNLQRKTRQALDQIELAFKLDVVKLNSSLLYTKASIQINANQFKQAKTILLDHLKTIQEEKDKLSFLILLAKSQLGLQDFESALDILEQTLNIHGQSPFTANLYEILSLKSYALSMKKDLIASIQNQKQLISLIEQSDQKDNLGSAYLQITGYYLEIGHLTEAWNAGKQAQTWIKDQPDDQLRILLNFAKINTKQSKLKQSLEYFNQLQAQVTSESARDIIAEMHYQRGFTYLNASSFDHALEDFRNAEKIYRELNKTAEVIQSQMSQANVLTNLGKINEAEKIFLSVLNTNKDDLSIKGDVNNSLAFLYAELGQYSKAQKYSQVAENAYKQANQKNRIPEVLNARGLLFLKMNDFDQAEVIFARALKLNTDFDNPLLDSEITNNLGGLYKSKGDLEKARNQLMKTAELQKKLGFESLLALTFNNIGSVYLEEKKYEDALDYLRQSRSFSEKYKLKRELAFSWNNEGFLFSEQEKFEEAQKAYGEALKLFKELELKIDMARTLNSLSILASKQKEFLKALDLAQNAISYLSLGTLDANKFFPNPDQKSILAPNFMINILQNKADILRKLADSTGDEAQKVKYLEASFQTFNLSVELIEALRAQIQGEESQKMLLQANIDIFQQLIAILFELGNKAPGKGYHEKAFYFAEMSRARSFLDQLQEQVARTALTLPQEIRDREEGLKSKIAFLDKNIFVELKKPQEEQEQSKIEQWQLEKTATLLDYKTFTNELEEKFPAFANLKYPKVYDVEMVRQELLDEKTLMLVFFLGADVSYGWSINKKRVSMIALPPNADIDRLIRKYRKTLVDPLIHEDPEDDEIVIDSTQSHIAVGLQIYRKIIEPLIKDVGQEAKQLIIVPDGVLYYLPFAATLVQIHPQTDQRFPGGREYLLHRYAINYTPSVSVLGMIQNQVKARDPKLMAQRKTFIGFGDPEYKPKKELAEDFEYNPTFEQQGFYELARLFNSKMELEEIASFFPQSSTTFLREQAKESVVKSSVEGYKYVHFATHGIIDERNPEFSGVILNLVQEDEPEDGFLQASEIFDLKLNADLVVLSACETGLGKVIKGEGMVGLTRAFLFAGTPSIVVSLWTVADESTSKLMIYFYKYLEEGLPKDEALRQARLALMVEKEDDEYLFPDPFFWGPFILNGVSS